MCLKSEITIKKIIEQTKPTTTFGKVISIYALIIITVQMQQLNITNIT